MWVRGLAFSWFKDGFSHDIYLELQLSPVKHLSVDDVVIFNTCFFASNSPERERDWQIFWKCIVQLNRPVFSGSQNEPGSHIFSMGWWRLCLMAVNWITEAFWNWSVPDLGTVVFVKLWLIRSIRSFERSPKVGFPPGALSLGSCGHGGQQGYVPNLRLSSLILWKVSSYGPYPSWICCPSFGTLLSLRTNNHFICCRKGNIWIPP